MSNSTVSVLRESLGVALQYDKNFLLNYLLIMLDVQVRPGTPQTELAKRIGFSRAGISRALERMGAFGNNGIKVPKPLVQVDPDPNDRRLNLVYLTSEGEKLLERVLEPLAKRK
jgi:DNA-binding MarR family transcriptional regulator